MHKNIDTKITFLCIKLSMYMDRKLELIDILRYTFTSESQKWGVTENFGFRTANKIISILPERMILDYNTLTSFCRPPCLFVRYVE